MLYTIIILINKIIITISIERENIDLLTPIKAYGEGCGYDGCPRTVEGYLNVHIVPHTHGELGYTRTFYEHYTGYDDFYDHSEINMKKILDVTLTELWANSKRRFTISDMPYFFHWWANRDGTVHRMIYELLRQGRLHFVGGGWGMCDEATTNYQAIIDLHTFSLRKINSSFLDCARPLVSWQADVFGHSKEYASLMAQMGFDGLFINPISFDDEIERMQRKAMEFVWRGSDDLGIVSDIFTHKLFDGYWTPPGFCFGGLCSDPLIITSDSMFSNVQERVDLFLSQVQHRQGPHYSTQNIMVIMGKRLGYYDAGVWFSNIDKLINLVNQKSHETSTKVNVFYSAPPCYLKSVNEANPQLERKQDDFYPFAYDRYVFATGLYTSRPSVKYLAKEGNIFLQICKQLQVLARLPNNDRTFEEMNWIVGVMQDHNVITGAMRIRVKNYYVKKMYEAMQRGVLLMKQAFNKLRDSPTTTLYYKCAFNISNCRNTNARRKFIIIYNPLSWPVTIPVRLPTLSRKYVVYDPNGQEVPAFLMKIPDPVMGLPLRTSVADHELVFIATDIPPLGYKSYYSEYRFRRRVKKSLVKKLNKNNKKKYYIRQINPFKPGEDILEREELENIEYDEPTGNPETKILFANVSESREDLVGVQTPRERIEEMTEPDITSTTIDYFKDFYNTTMEMISVPPVTTETVKTTTTTTTTASTTENTNPKIRIDDYVKSKDLFIKNKYITINIDSSRKVTNVTLSNGITINLDIQYYYYASDDPVKMGKPQHKSPGAYIFRPMDPKPVPIIDFIDTKIYKNEIVEELHCRYSDYASFVLRLYVDSPVIEVDWVAGPIPIDDEIGKDVFIRYMTNLIHNGTFYTDANGRQTVKRIRDERPSFRAVNLDPIAGNYYPVTSKIYIEDLEKNIRFSVFTDRAQGGTSLYDGEIDLMVHRRLLTDDSGVQTYLNETQNDMGIIIRGKHYLYLTKADFKPNRIFEKKFAKELLLAPQILVSKANPYGDDSQNIWLDHNNEFSGLENKLPLGIHILTLEQWNDNTILLRLENYLEKSDVIRSGNKLVKLKSLFTNIKVKNIKETTLGANMWIQDFTPMQWRKQGSYFRSFNEYYGGNGTEYIKDEIITPAKEVNFEEGIMLSPQQIRTFVVWYDFVET